MTTHTPSKIAELPTATTLTDKQQDLPQQTGSTWGRNALEGIKRLYQDEEARKEVARRLF